MDAAPRYPTRLRPSFRRRRWGVSAWLWFVLAIAFLLRGGGIGQIQEPQSFVGSSGGHGFLFVWLWKDGTLSVQPPRDEDNLLDETLAKDKYSIWIDTARSNGAPHRIFRAWLLDTTERRTATVTIRDDQGAIVAETARFAPFVADFASQSGELTSVSSRLQNGTASWTEPWPEAVAYNRRVITRAACIPVTIVIGLVGLLTFLFPRRDELRREFLAADKCPRCEYSIVDLEHLICPECGESLLPAATPTQSPCSAV